MDDGAKGCPKLRLKMLNLNLIRLFHFTSNVTQKTKYDITLSPQSRILLSFQQQKERVLLKIRSKVRSKSSGLLWLFSNEMLICYRIKGYYNQAQEGDLVKLEKKIKNAC